MALTKLGRSVKEFAWLGGDPIERFDSMPVVPSFTPIWCTWGDPAHEIPDRTIIKHLIDAGSTPVIFWQPDFNGAGQHQNILGGYWDDYIDRVSDVMQEFGKRPIIRFAHEQNGNWFSWSPGFGTNTEQSYIDMWRYVVTRFGTQSRFFWCPNANPPGIALSTYPGSDYVDIVGFDGYAWGANTSPASVIYSKIMAKVKTLNKPIIIGEWGVTREMPVEKRKQWIKDAVYYFDSNNVLGAIYFDIDMTWDGHDDWRLMEAGYMYNNMMDKRR